MSSSQYYDFAIVGAGAAGLNLARTIISDPFFDEARVIMLDKEIKDKNDRTWCFWEKGSGQWDTIIEHQWEKGLFFSPEHNLELDLLPYTYKKLRSHDLYETMHNQIGKAANMQWVRRHVLDITETRKHVLIHTKEGPISAGHCFDSRIDSGFSNENDGWTRILQHFKGWIVKFEQPVFDPGVFTMMDFRLRHENSTSFMYVLPTSEKEGLIEFTVFNDTLLDKAIYESYIRKYIDQYFPGVGYTIVEKEYGVIPMSNYPFHKASTEKITKIGTAGSWVRPSSGYSFKNAERSSKKIVANIKYNRPPGKGLLNKRHRFYDDLLLDILKKHNHLGPKIFTDMYARNKVSRIFKFLDGETNLLEELAIISSLKPHPFLKALMSKM